MKVLQTIGGFGAKGGGTSTCTYDLLSAIHNLDTDIAVDLLTPSVIYPSDRMMGTGEEWIKVVPNDYKTPLALSANVADYLKHNDYDIYHTNGLWMHTNHATCIAARKKGRPYIITPHGMLYPAALARSAWKKKIMRRVWFDKDIHNAACLHATCLKEMEHCRAFGYKGPVAVIPNPVIIPDGICVKKRMPSEKSIGFLGRLHPIKKVEALIYGMAEAIKQGAPLFRLDIIGAGDKDYEDFLRSEAARLGLSDRIDFVGFVNGEEKYKRLSNLWALFVPSMQENFGMIVPEALICGTPVYASTGTPWEELNSDGCGWWCDNSPETIATVIVQLFSKSESELLQMGSIGRALIEQKYEQTKVAKMMLELYQWILCRTERPSFVYE